MAIGVSNISTQSFGPGLQTLTPQQDANFAQAKLDADVNGTGTDGNVLESDALRAESLESAAGNTALANVDKNIAVSLNPNLNGGVNTYSKADSQAALVAATPPDAVDPRSYENTPYGALPITTTPHGLNGTQLPNFGTLVTQGSGSPTITGPNLEKPPEGITALIDKLHLTEILGHANALGGSMPLTPPSN